MPAKTERQRRFMAMCSHSPGKAHGKCPPKDVAREFAHRKKKHFAMPRKNKAGYY